MFICIKYLKKKIMKKILLYVLTLATFSVSAQNRSYVDKDATGNNDGTSWTNAYVQLEDGFVNATTGMEIWVADGTYKRQNANRAYVFSWSADSVKVYGGFSGVETLLLQRDWTTNKTIMSGDIGVVGDASDNCYTVFGGATNGDVVNPLEYGYLDGFFIQDGNANINNSGFGSVGAGFNMFGGGKKMKFHNCEFSNNNAKNATAVYANAGGGNQKHLILDACVIKNNRGRYGVGTQIDCTTNQMNLTITNCLYVNNETKDMGSLGLGTNSIVYIKGNNGMSTFINVDITNTTFANNQNNGTVPSNSRGSIMFYNGSGVSGSSLGKDINIDNCVFWGNTGDTTSVIEHLSTLNNFNSVSITNTISEYPSFPTYATLTNVILQNPLFISNTDFTLQSGSPAIDAGSLIGLSIPLYDLTGNNRVSGAFVDLGCYEFQDGVGIQYINQNLYLNIYPNPTTGQLNFNTNTQINTIEIYNLTGQKVLSFNNTNAININELTNGIYMAKVFTANGSIATRKIIKK